MNTYSVQWTAYGEATIEADSEEQATQIAREGLFGWSGDIDWETNRVDGASYNVEVQG